MCAGPSAVFNVLARRRKKNHTQADIIFIAHINRRRRAQQNRNHVFFPQMAHLVYIVRQCIVLRAARDRATLDTHCAIWFITSAATAMCGLIHLIIWQFCSHMILSGSVGLALRDTQSLLVT